MLVPSLLLLIGIACWRSSRAIWLLNDKLLAAQTDYAVSTAGNFFSRKVATASMFGYNATFQNYFQTAAKPADIGFYASKDVLTGQLTTALDNMSAEKVEQEWVGD